MLVPGRIPFQAISSRRCEQVFIKVSDGLVRSQILYCSHSVAASASSDSVIQARASKKLSRVERRAIVEAFVDMYRDSNQGRFPTASHARHHTGGSYYVVKNIIQELTYKHRVSGCPVNKELHLREKEVAASSEQQKKLFSSTEESCTYKDPLDYAVNLSGNTVDTIEKDENKLVKVEGISLVDSEPFPFYADEPEKTLLSQTVDVTHVNIKSKDDGHDSIHLNMSTASIQSTTVIHQEFKPFFPDFKMEGQWTCSHPEEKKTLKVEKTECFQDDHKKDEDIYSHSQDELEKLEVEKAKDFKGALNYKEVDHTNDREVPREHLQRYGDKEPSTKESGGIWNNLKSLAGDILRFWKQM